MIRRILIFMFITVISINSISAQDNSTETAESSQVNASESLTVDKIDPVLPQTGSSVIFIEGEDAVATNFNREPILNYSCSGYETLQLNQATGLQGDSVYYADYVFYAEEDGIYEFWYGGTPPGNKDELLPSFSSPFHYKLDSYYEYDVYREDVHVAGNYAPAYYWNYVSDLTLSKGEHRITFEIPQRRSFDSKFYFYLDNFFLVKKVNGERVLKGKIPDVFPKNMDDRSMDAPFKSIEDYEILIRDNPDQSRNYIEIAMIYSLIGDYLSSLKNLRKALLLEPDDPEIMLLIAKNLIWKGSFSDGLYAYSDLLQLVPERTDIWAEAGKVSAWTGQYETSKKFFKDAIDLYPDNLNLQVNLGITYLWSGDAVEAEKQFELADKIAGDSLILNKNLAGIFEVNGYPDKAIVIYKKIIKLFPEDLETRFLLEEAYIKNNQRDKIDSLRKNTSDLYITSPDLEKTLQLFYNKQVMKDKVINDYKDELKNDPDNLVLRKTLAEIYFWNGDKKKAINEYLNILANYSYRNIKETDKSTVQFNELLDRGYALHNFLNKVPAYLSSSSKELSTNFSNYKKALSLLDTLQKKNEELVAKGEEPTLDAINAAQDQLDSAENLLADSIGAKESFINKFQSILTQFTDDSDYLNRLIEEEKNVNETYKKLTEGSQWNWDRNVMVGELELVNKNGLDLAGYVLARINQIEGKLNNSAIYLDKLRESNNLLDDVPAAAFENSLWLGDKDKQELIFNEYTDKIEASASYMYDLIDYLDYLNLEDDDFMGFLGEDPAGDIDNILKSFTQIKSYIRTYQKSVNNEITSIHKMLKTKMVQGFYKLAEDTYLLRNELGDFYQNEKMFPEAIKQYRQVLAIDPWNLSAKYKLGLVNHWNGNWAKAMSLYNEVYQEDPTFGNVTSFYNELAREHADYLNYTASTFADSSKLSFLSSVVYRHNINGAFSLVTDYSIEGITIFLESPDSNSGTIQTLTGKLPINLSLFTISPLLGINIISDYLFDSDTNPLSYLQCYTYKLRAGASLSTSFGPVILDGTYLYDWERDTLVSGSPVSYQQGDASAQLDFAFTNRPVLKDSSMRLSGYGKLMNDSNIIWGSFFELINSNLLRSEPDISLNIKGNFSFEDSTSSSSSYSSPDGVLYAGGGLELLGSHSLSGDTLLNNKLRLVSGYYIDGDNSGVSFEIGDTLGYERKAFSGYFRVFSTFKNRIAPDNNPMDYWSLTIELGGNANLPDLLSL